MMRKLVVFLLVVAGAAADGDPAYDGDLGVSAPPADSTACPLIWLRGPLEPVKESWTVWVGAWPSPAAFTYAVADLQGGLLAQGAGVAPLDLNGSAPPAGGAVRIQVALAEPSCPAVASALFVLGRAEARVPQPWLDVRTPALAAAGMPVDVTFEVGREGATGRRIRVTLEQERPIVELAALDAPQARINFTLPLQVPCVTPGVYAVVARGMGRLASAKMVVRRGNCSANASPKSGNPGPQALSQGELPQKVPRDPAPAVGVVRPSIFAPAEPRMSDPAKTSRAPKIGGFAASARWWEAAKLEAKYIYYLGALGGGVAGLVLATIPFRWRKPRTPST